MHDSVPIKIEFKLEGDGVKALNDLAKSTGSAVAAFCASALDQFVPQRRIWAFNNYKKFIEHCEVENAKRKEAGKRPIASRFAHPAFQVIGDEDNDEMLALWSRLMANLQDADTDISGNRAFIGMLQSMEPIDARVLKWICDIQRDDDRNLFVYVNAVDAAKKLNLDCNKLLLSMHNLSRIGAVDTVGLLDMSRHVTLGKKDESTNNGMLPGLAILKFDTMYFRLTILGIALVDSCRTVGDAATLSTSVEIN